MKNSKLIKLLQCFSKPELNRLKLFIDSPFFNKNLKLKKLMTYINGYAPRFDNVNFTYENAYQQIFSEKKYQKEPIIKLFSKLFDLTEQFIFHDQLKEDSTTKKIALLQFYNQQNLIAYFRSTLKSIRKVQDNAVIKNDIWAFNQLQIEHEYAHFLSANADNGTGDINLQATNDALDIFFLQKKLKYFCYMKNRQRLVSFPYKLTLEEELNQYAESDVSIQDPIILIWRDAFNLLSHPKSLTAYQQLKSNLIHHSSHIEMSDKRVLFTYLQNMAKFVFEDFFEELFSLYKTQLKENILYENHFLLPVTFKNIVSVSLRLKEYTWAKDFIERHREKIIPSHKDKDSIYFLCLAILHFSKGEFDEALEILNQARINNLYTKLEERRLRLKIYFEMEYRLLFEDGINSFRKFLSENRKHIATYYLNANRDFLNTIFYLFNSGQYDQKRFDKLKKTVEETAFLPEKEWILQKIP